MFLKYPVIYVFIIVLSSYDMDAQICKRLEVVTSKVEATNSFLVTYYDQCPALCIKTKWVTTNNRRPVIKSRLKSVQYCCKGYIQDNDLSNDGHIECKAICMPACKNGYCSTPGVCACNPGYNQDPKDDHNCLPICKNGCAHGACVAPNKCQCDFGYSLVDGTCHPICTEPCHNGTCVAPETCECSPGYRKSEKNLCEPYCSNGCDNGLCTAPETCQCNPGWHLTESGNLPIKICKPLCSTPCNNGVCVAAETCNCSPSYKKSASGICEPVCSEGWKSDGLKCVAQCTHQCGNGKCVSPNVCVCSAGYRIDIDKLRMGLTGAPLCVPSCIDCDENKGFCVAPGVCIDKDSTSLPPRLCEDFQNCSDATTWTTPGTDATIKTYDTYDDNFDIMTNVSISQENIEPTSYKMNNASSKDGAGNGTLFDDGEFIGNKDNAKLTNTWLQQHWTSILIPVLVIVTAGIIMILVLRWKPIIIYFKGSSYVIDDDVVYNNGSYAFEEIQISPKGNEKEAK